MNGKKVGIRLILLSLLLYPVLQVLLTISYNSNYLIGFPFQILIFVIIIILILVCAYGIKLFFKDMNLLAKALKKSLQVLTCLFLIVYIVGCISFLVLLYGPNDKFKTWLITTAMQTMNHQYLCKWFYSEEQINEVLNANYVKESGESTDESLIDITKPVISYIDEYDKEILDVEEDTKYKIIELDINGQKGYLAAIYDPSKVKLQVTSSLGARGEYVTKMAEKSNAILAINGGGFYDPNHSSLGGTPNGTTISNGKIITNAPYNSSTGGIIGFTNDNVLVLLKNTSAEEAIDKGVRDAVSWGPFLIVNGSPSFIRGNGGWGYAARTAIGQRKDGIVLFLVVDANASRTKGADMVDLTEIMLRYHAINAANLDGGTSSVMVLPKDIAKNKYGATCHDYFTNYACAINDPIDSTGAHQTRYIADAWVVLE